MELGEGIIATCQLPEEVKMQDGEKKPNQSAKPESNKAHLSSLTRCCKPAGKARPCAAAQPEPIRQGQIRNSALRSHSASKKIEVALGSPAMLTRVRRHYEVRADSPSSLPFWRVPVSLKGRAWGMSLVKNSPSQSPMRTPSPSLPPACNCRGLRRRARNSAKPTSRTLRVHPLDFRNLRTARRARRASSDA